MGLSLVGLLVENAGEQFDKAIQSARETSDLSEDEFEKKLESKFNEIAEAYEDIIAEAYQKIYTIKYDKFIDVHVENQRQISELNREPFKGFFSYLNTVYLLNKKLQDKVKEAQLTETESIVIALYAHLMRMGDQIGVMLLNGYNDGALILWRSFYEHAATLTLLISLNDNNLTAKFINHSIRSQKKKAESFSKHVEELKFPPLEQRIIDTITTQQQQLKELHGKEFIDNDYGWADDLFPGKQKATLRGIEDLLGWGRYRVFYIWASQYAHSGFLPLTDYVENNTIILPRITQQSTDLKGIIDPIQLTLAIFHEVNNHILYFASVKHEYILNTLVFRKIYDKTLLAFHNSEVKEE
ncbi:hypothetical protein GO755_30440 [Spirosoma sp. HMF4905]|uniref:Uncharacterized protein n=1 Tax=Spirosoma arboris TaxID=2682092 RepID=A0A7K1SKR4_9BACT|nr:DUF5677 domain-containing protein [Spirosoma arboris]MVM34390.1 hypothetical protein [Spirosoma arboris]